MTKYSTLANIGKVGKNTVFERCLTGDLEMDDCPNDSPDDFDNVLYLGHAPDYGDVFKAWDDDKSWFLIFLGEKGDEFND